MTDFSITNPLTPINTFTLSGTITPSNSMDRWFFSVEQTVPVFFTINSGWENVGLSLHDSHAGYQLVYYNVNQTPPIHTPGQLGAGSYYVLIDDLNIFDPNPAPYTFTISTSVSANPPPNNQPTGASLSSRSVLENSANGTIVGTVVGQDPDFGDTLLYSLQDSAGGRFEISAFTGQITVANGSLLDYETATSHSITVRVTDQGGMARDVGFTIDVINVNEPVFSPEIGVSGNSANIVDGSAAPSGANQTDFGSGVVGSTPVVRTFRVDNTGSANLTTSNLILPPGYSLVEALATTIIPGSFDTFAVQLDTATPGIKSGQISFATNDADENPFNFSITGAVSDINHAPVITSNGGGDNAFIAVWETASLATNVTVADQDGNFVGFAIVGGADASQFRINALNGALSFVTPPNFEAPTDADHNNSYIVQIRVTDSGTPPLSDTQTITVQVADLQQFQPAAFKSASFGPGAGNWYSDDRYHREVADVNGDGRADIVGFGDAGVFVQLGSSGGSFFAPFHALAAFGPSAGGWGSNDKYPRHLADVNGDHMADIVGFGDAGVFVSLATGGGSFGAPVHRLAAFGFNAGGWSSDTRYHRELADVNGDGMDDIVGFGDAGVFVSLATGGGSFGTAVHRLSAFGPSAGGWFSDDRYPRHLADVNGDHMADIVGFGDAGVWVSLAIGGGSFGAPSLKLAAFGANTGWFSDDRYPREVADVNGDGRADIVGFADTGVWVSFGNGDGSFQPVTPDLAAFGVAGGWYSDDRYPRHLADLNRDGTADIVGFGEAGVFTALSTGFHLI